MQKTSLNGIEDPFLALQTEGEPDKTGISNLVRKEKTQTACGVSD
jgi:hypothetical protein